MGAETTEKERKRSEISGPDNSDKARKAESAVWADTILLLVKRSERKWKETTGTVSQQEMDCVDLEGSEVTKQLLEMFWMKEINDESEDFELRDEKSENLMKTL